MLHHRDVKLKKDFVDVLSALAGFDILFLLATFFLFTLPTWSEVSDVCVLFGREGSKGIPKIELSF